MNGVVLKRLGHNVRVLEANSSTDRADHGAGITVGPKAQEFLGTYDLTKEPCGVYCPGLQILNVDSRVKFSVKRPMQMSSWNVLYYRLRANFDGYKSMFCPKPPLKMQSDGEALLEIGAKVTDVSYIDGLVTVDYTNVVRDTNHSAKADLVIAADGASSTIRQIMMPELQRNYSGYFAWRGYVPENEISEETRQLFDPKLSFFTYSGGYILWCAKPFPFLNPIPQFAAPGSLGPKR
jgi:2-polyprenyl-6-methoxyphenol hydroxylase-like FAD-dependent oxidoreductase